MLLCSCLSWYYTAALQLRCNWPLGYLSLLGCFAICHILLGWKTCKYYESYYETDELPNSRPTQPKKKWVKSGIWATFFPTFFPRQIFFRGLGLILYRKQSKINSTLPIFPQTPYFSALLALCTRDYGPRLLACRLFRNYTLVREMSGDAQHAAARTRRGMRPSVPLFVT